jgi:enamine deaminase RidA (YjgF/YER057c/UK114 family)
MHDIVQPKGWKPAKGYANGVLAAEGRTLYIGGQIGWTEDQTFETDDFVEQTAQALRNVVAVLKTAGGLTQHLVRLTWYVTDKSEYVARQREIGAVYREILGRHFPAMSLLVVGGLVEDRALVEIEATAVIPHGRGYTGTQR